MSSVDPTTAEARETDHFVAHSQLTPYFALNQSSLPTPGYTRYVASAESKQVNLALAQSSLTLLKNVRSQNASRGLPLNNVTDILGESTSPRDGPSFGDSKWGLFGPAALLSRALSSGFKKLTSRYLAQLSATPLDRDSTA